MSTPRSSCPASNPASPAPPTSEPPSPSDPPHTPAKPSEPTPTNPNDPEPHHAKQAPPRSTSESYSYAWQPPDLQCNPIVVRNLGVAPRHPQRELAANPREK